MADSKKTLTKTAVYQELAAETGLAKKEIAAVFDALDALIKREVGKRGPGTFTIPGLVKFRVRIKEATKARPGRNPKTGEPMTIPAKPKHKVIKAYVLKPLKETIA
jgi:nucleoid DNA-binding protein